MYRYSLIDKQYGQLLEIQSLKYASSNWVACAVGIGI